jgi:hypothetical protein
VGRGIEPLSRLRPLDDPHQLGDRLRIAGDHDLVFDLEKRLGLRPALAQVAHGHRLHACSISCFTPRPRAAFTSEIRVPISDVSLAGYCALHRQTLNVADCYDQAELARISTTLHHDNSFDKRTGFRTTQMLAMPILHENRVPVGVIQLINKKHGGRFAKEDEANLSRVAKTLGIAFHNQTQLRRPTKFEYLVAQHRVSQDEVNAALAEARAKQIDVETILVEHYKVPKSEMGTALSTFYRVPYVEFDERIVPPPDLMKDLKLEYLKTNYWLPLKREEDGSILVLIDNPQDIQKVDSINQLMPRQRLHFAVGLRKDIITFLTASSGDSRPGTPSARSSET